MAWTQERLESVAASRLGGAKLIVVANREPYIHHLAAGKINLMRPAFASYPDAALPHSPPMS